MVKWISKFFIKRHVNETELGHGAEGFLTVKWANAGHHIDKQEEHLILKTRASVTTITAGKALDQALRQKARRPWASRTEDRREPQHVIMCILHRASAAVHSRAGGGTEPPLQNTAKTLALMLGVLCGGSASKSSSPDFLGWVGHKSCRVSEGRLRCSPSLPPLGGPAEQGSVEGPCCWLTAGAWDPCNQTLVSYLVGAPRPVIEARRRESGPRIKNREWFPFMVMSPHTHCFRLGVGSKRRRRKK